MPTKGTTPTQIRLTDSDKAKLAILQETFGLPSLASAVRFAIQNAVTHYAARPAEDSPEKSRKRA